MAKTYTTQQGDAWDAIAHKVYGSETYTGWLMQNNLPLLDIFVFEAGVISAKPCPPPTAHAVDALPRKGVGMHLGRGRRGARVEWVQRDKE